MQDCETKYYSAPLCSIWSCLFFEVFPAVFENCLQCIEPASLAKIAREDVQFCRHKSDGFQMHQVCCHIAHLLPPATDSLDQHGNYLALGDEYLYLAYPCHAASFQRPAHIIPGLQYRMRRPIRYYIRHNILHFDIMTIHLNT